MIKRVFFLSLLFCVATSSWAQGWLPIGARANSMANAVVADTDVWSYYHNPGAMGYLSTASLGASYENRYLLKELQTQALVYGQPIKGGKAGVVSLGLQSYGHRVYRTNRFGVGYALKLHEKIAMGVQLNYQDIWIQNYDYIGTVTAELGILAKVTDKISLGFSVMNLNRARITRIPDDRFGTFFRLGMKYQVSRLVAINAELEKEVKSKLRPRVAIDYQMVNRFFLRVGGAFNPPEVAFGFGYNFDFGLKLDAGSSWRQHLGWSPHFGITYDFKSKNKE